MSEQILLTGKEAAELLRVSQSSLAALRRKGLPCVKLGKRALYKRDAILKFIDEQQTTTKE